VVVAGAAGDMVTVVGMDMVEDTATVGDTSDTDTAAADTPEAVSMAEVDFMAADSTAAAEVFTVEAATAAVITKLQPRKPALSQVEGRQKNTAHGVSRGFLFGGEAGPGEAKETQTRGSAFTSCKLLHPSSQN